MLSGSHSNKTDDQLSLINHDSGVSLVDLLDEFTDFLQQEKSSELEKQNVAKPQNLPQGKLLIQNQKVL